jgi:hypothetical protein
MAQRGDRVRVMVLVLLRYNARQSPRCDASRQLAGAAGHDEAHRDEAIEKRAAPQVPQTRIDARSVGHPPAAIRPAHAPGCGRAARLKPESALCISRVTAGSTPAEDVTKTHE